MDSNFTSPLTNTTITLPLGTPCKSKEDFIANGMDSCIPPSDFRCLISQSTPSGAEFSTASQSNYVYTTSSPKDPSRSEDNISPFNLSTSYSEIVTHHSAIPQSDDGSSNNQREPGYNNHIHVNHPQNPFSPLSTNLFGNVAIQQLGTDNEGRLPTPLPILPEGEGFHNPFVGTKESWWIPA